MGSYREQIVYENGVIGGDKLVLDGTSTSVGTTTPSDVSIILEIVYNQVVMIMILRI